MLITVAHTNQYSLLPIKKCINEAVVAVLVALLVVVLLQNINRSGERNATKSAPVFENGMAWNNLQNSGMASYRRRNRESHFHILLT